MRRMRWFVLGMSVVVLSSLVGCQTMRRLGFESKSARIARELQQQKEDLSNKNTELETRLVSTAAEEQKAKLKAAQLQAELDARGKVESKSSNERWIVLSKELTSQGLPVVSGKDGRGVRLSSDIIFQSGKCEVRSDAKPLLAKLAKVISKVGDDVIVFIDGHTDSDPLRVTKNLYKDNYGLGVARANAVARELVAHGVARPRLVTRSFGQDAPLANNKTANGKKQNRRVEIGFIFTESPQISLKKKTN